MKRLSEITTSDGRVLRVGDRVPMPERKLVVEPAHWVDDPARSPAGVFHSKGS